MLNLNPPEEKVFVAMTGHCVECANAIEAFMRDDTTRCLSCWVAVVKAQMKEPDHGHVENQLKNALAKPGMYYGDGGTWHETKQLDVEIYRGEVVAVWYRCMALPFRTSDASAQRAEEMRQMYDKNGTQSITGVEILIAKRKDGR